MGQRHNRVKARPLFWEWMRAEKTSCCSAHLCLNIVNVGDMVIGIIPQHYPDPVKKEPPKYWCVECSPEKCKRLLEA